MNERSAAELLRRWHEVLALRRRRIAELDRELEALESAIRALPDAPPVPPPAPAAPTPPAALPRAISDTDRKAARRRHVLDVIAKGAPIDHGELAIACYGEDSRLNRKRLRHLLWYLGHTGRIRNLRYGVWEIRR